MPLNPTFHMNALRTCRVCRPARVIGALLGLALSTQGALAQDAAQDYLTALDRLVKPEPKPVSIGVPSGFGASGGLIFGAVAYTDQDPNTGVKNDADGSIALGVGLGDPVDGIALEAVLGITSVSTSFWGDGRFGDEGNLSLKVHKRIAGLPGADSASVALGIGNVAGWGGTRDLPTSVSLAYSQVNSLHLFGTILPSNLTVGYSSAISDVDREPGAFASFGLGLTSQFSAGFGWVGDELQVGAVYFPDFFPMSSLALTYADATRRNSDSGRLIVSLNFAFDPER